MATQLTPEAAPLRALSPDMAMAVVGEIDRRLDRLLREQAVAVPLAIESGSRAWGFPSPDSDYDCRFVFIRSRDRYLSPWPSRDVIELPLEGEFDVNGWDLGKALKLMLKGNAVILEWLQSPIVYRGDAGFRDEFLALARRHVSREALGLHYLHLGEGQWRKHFGDGQTEVPIKKAFYLLRPAAVLRWMAHHPDQVVPPMNFVTLVGSCAMPPAVADAVAELLERKAVTRELGSATPPSWLADFVHREFALAHAWLDPAFVRTTAEARQDAEAFFRRSIERFGPSGV